MAYDYDLIVIGGGSAGVRMARWSGLLGAKVAICEEDRLGGTCVIRGCIPKKLMSLGAHFLDEVEVMDGYGWSVTEPRLDFKGFKKNRNQEIARLSKIYEGLLEKYEVRRYYGTAQFVDSHTVNVGEHKISARYIVIAVGGEPARLEVPGAELAWTSNDIFDLETCPRSMVIVGGGYIGVEFAGIFNGYGSEVTLLCRRPAVLSHFDEDIRYFLQQEMQKKGVQTQLNCKIKKIQKTESGFVVTGDEGLTYEAEGLLLATGRRPKTTGLGLEGLGVKTKENGAIVVNENYETSVSGVFAIGDCSSRFHLTPVATAEGMALAEALFGRGKRRVSYEFIPTAVFSHPPVATVGYTEKQARAQFVEVEIYKTEFRSLKFTLMDKKLAERTMIKLIVDKSSQRVVGCHMVGMDAPEIIQGMAVAMKAGATKADFDSTLGIHPTSAEEFVTLRDPLNL